MTTNNVIVVLCFLACCCTLKLAGQNTIELRLITERQHSSFGVLEVRGLEENLLKALARQLAKGEKDYYDRSFFPLQDDGTLLPGLPAMLGQVEASANDLLFVPRFPFEQGRSYQAAFHITTAYAFAGLISPSGMPEIITKQITIPWLSHDKTPTVTGIYPSATQWPANQLKFYISFLHSHALWRSASTCQVVR